MSAAIDEHLKNIAYRRGTVMGLTAAEAFMLIAFILLFMLVAWRSAVEREASELKEANEALAPILEEFDSQESLGLAIRLVQDKRLRDLMVTAQHKPEEQLKKLTDMVSSDDMTTSLAVLEEIQEAGLVADDVRQTAPLLAEVEALRKEVAEYAARAEAAEQALAEVKKTSDRALRTGADIAQTISQSAGGEIEKLGGRVLPDGDVIFPDSILFSAGSANISSEFDELLSSFCRLWFETLHEQREDLEVVQLEGHASSEFADLGEAEAFVANLDLSQRRAAAVFVRCLDYGGNDEIASWARDSMAAIGYSSSRPILLDGVENKRVSRRVVFAIKPKTANDLVAEVLDGVVTNTPTPEPSSELINSTPPASGERGGLSNIPDIEAYRQRSGTWIKGGAEVTDGDTIFVASRSIRLQGLHAEEIDTLRGRQARDFMANLLSNKTVACWLNGEKSYDREIGVCFTDGQDIAAKLVMATLGWDCPAYSGGRYDVLQSVQQRSRVELPDYCL